MIPLPPSCRIPLNLKRGDKGPGVRVLQEWLTLHGHRLTIDGDFGPATERALSAWREPNDAGEPGDPVGPLDVKWLTAPMHEALAATGSLVDIARAHLAAHPREVGGPNRGPWVRLYAGDSGEGQAWCMHFARFAARQAGHPWAARISPSCDVTAAHAREDGRLSALPEVGGLFLVRGKTAGDWTHGGIVTGVGDGWIATAEANTNDEGSREGYEACARVRGVSRLDFVRMGP